MAAYYNEFDPYAAEWLRNLIAAGHVAPGDVDERSLLDVSADDLRGYTQCHFFAGIGVWSYALRQAGWADDRPIWTGSCPCQPFSAAGKQEGFADERHLWPVWFRLIDQRRPPTVVGEQVASALGWLDLVSADMEGAGYSIGAADLCAAGFGGAHIRQRLYFVGMADRDNAGSQGHWQSRNFDAPQGWATAGRYRAESGVVGRVADACKQRRDWQHPLLRPETSGRDTPALQQTTGGRDAGGVGNPQASGWAGEPLRTNREQAFREPQVGDAGGVADDAGKRRHGREDTGGQAGRHGAEICGAAHNARAPMLGRDAADWLLCRDAKWRPVRPGSFPLADAPPARVGRLRAYGNALDAETATQFCGTVREICDMIDTIDTSIF
jgi:DNA (cytosine-5)-methyltransferase 1